MLYLIEFIFYLLFFVFKLYSLIDSNYIFSAYGGKLRKYISKDNLSNITCNFGTTKINNFIQNFYSKKLKSLDSLIIKKFCIIFLITITLIILKINVSYKFLKSNFLFINIFNKNIDISLILGNGYIYFKFLYILLYSFLVFNITYKIHSYIYSKKKLKEKEVQNIQHFPIVEFLSEDKRIVIPSAGLYQNILITGSIGSGKTSAAISTILEELLVSSVYGLVIDVKGNYIKTLNSILKRAGLEQKLVEISMESEFSYNPLNSNTTEIELAARLKKVLLVLSNKNTSDAYWLDKAEGYMRDFIVLIRAYTKEVNFFKLHKMVTSKEYLYEKLEIIKENILNNKYDEEHLFKINSAMLNIKNEYLKLDERTIGIIKSEITRITSVFCSDKKIYDKFCKNSININFENENIYVLSLDIGKNRELAKIISAYLKLEFQAQILSRKEIKKPIFFVCDEYQEIVNELDASFFSLSREYKCINVISTQSYSSLLNALKDEHSTGVILQNFVNKIWFRNDDPYTISQIIKQLGKKIKKYETINYSESSQDSKYNIFLNNFKNYKSGLSKSVSISEKEDYVITEDFFSKELKTFEASMIISDGTNIKFVDKIKLKRWDEKDEKIQ